MALAARSPVLAGKARAAVRNGRGIAALLKMGAVQEGVLRKAFLRDGEYHDQGLYTILADEWKARAGSAVPARRVHVH